MTGTGAARIAMVVSTLQRAGPTTQLRYLATGLDRRRFDPLVITLSVDPPHSDEGLFREAGIPLRTLGLSRPASALVGSHRLQILLQEEGVDLLHTQGFRADVLAGRLTDPCPWISTLRNDPPTDYGLQYGMAAGRMMSRLQLRALRRCHVTVGVSEALRRALKRRGLDPVAIRNGVDVDRFRPPEVGEREALRRDLDVPAHSRLILSVGSLISRKAPERLIRAFLRAAPSTGATLVLLGDGPLRSKLESAVAGDERIRFAGTVPDVAPYLRAADAFALLSESEGFPNAALEALATGLPLLLSAIGPHKELASVSPGAVRLVPDGEEEDGVRAILGVQAGERVSDLELIRDRISHRRMASSYGALYEDVLNGSKR